MVDEAASRDIPNITFSLLLFRTSGQDLYRGIIVLWKSSDSCPKKA
jgi:hypothetical protein